MAIIKSVSAWGMTVLTRYPGVVAVFGFAAGVSSFFLVEREQEIFAQALSILMLASWLERPQLLGRAELQPRWTVMPQSLQEAAAVRRLMES